MSNLKAKLKDIKAIFLDVDGVLTDGKVLTLPDGDQIRSMNIKDGYALQHAVKKGYHIAIISGGTSESVRLRLNGLGIEEVHLGCKHKKETFLSLLEKWGLNLDQVIYMGDDLPDYPVMQKVGFAACPADAAEEIKAISQYVCSKKGGEGCVREILEQVMRLHNNWLDKDAFTW